MAWHGLASGDRRPGKAIQICLLQETESNLFSLFNLISFGMWVCVGSYITISFSLLAPSVSRIKCHNCPKHRQRITNRFLVHCVLWGKNDFTLLSCLHHSLLLCLLNGGQTPGQTCMISRGCPIWQSHSLYVCLLHITVVPNSNRGPS